MKEETLIPAASTPVSGGPGAKLDANENVVPHVTSMVVWDVPSPIVLNTKFKIKVGVKCAEECNLTRSVVEIYDHTQALVATGTLGGKSLLAINTLYWTEMELQAPDAEEQYNWTARFLRPELEVPHTEASHEFTFGTVQPPEHVVTVRVTDKEKKTPINHAQVILHPFTGFTDASGIARVGVATGEYKLWIPKIAKYDTWRMTVKVENDIAVQAELVLAPVPEP